MKTIKYVFFSVAVAAILIIGLATVHAATIDCTNTQALNSQEAIECGASGTNTINNPGTTATTSLNNTIASVINVLSVMVAAVAVIMIIVGGFRYVTSGGKQESVTGAKNTIMYAIIGLVIVALAQIIVQFVLTKANT